MTNVGNILVFAAEEWKRRAESAESRASALAAEVERLRGALGEIEIICTESAADCRKRMGTRVGNCLATARAALSPQEPKP